LNYPHENGLILNRKTLVDTFQHCQSGFWGRCHTQCYYRSALGQRSNQTRSAGVVLYCVQSVRSVKVYFDIRRPLLGLFITVLQVTAVRQPRVLRLARIGSNMYSTTKQRLSSSQRSALIPDSLATFHLFPRSSRSPLVPHSSPNTVL